MTNASALRKYSAENGKTRSRFVYASAMEQNTFEKRYDPEQQSAILQLAARLQSEHADSLSHAELERLAGEIGIDPAFVRAASRQLSEGAPARKPRKRLSGWLLKGWVLSLAVLQIFTLRWSMEGSFGPMVLGLALVGVLGALLPDSKAGRQFGLIAVTALGLLSLVLVPMIRIFLPYNALGMFGVLALELLAFLAGNTSSSVVAFVKRAFSQVGETLSES